MYFTPVTHTHFKGHAFQGTRISRDIHFKGHAYKCFDVMRIQECVVVMVSFVTRALRYFFFFDTNFFAEL